MLYDLEATRREKQNSGRRPTQCKSIRYSAHTSTHHSWPPRLPLAGEVEGLVPNWASSTILDLSYTCTYYKGLRENH